MVDEISKLQNIVNDIKNNLTSVIDSQIYIHESLKAYYLQLLEYSKGFENDKKMRELEKNLIYTDAHINEMKRRIDKINELAKKE